LVQYKEKKIKGTVNSKMHDFLTEKNAGRYRRETNELAGEKKPEPVCSKKRGKKQSLNGTGHESQRRPRRKGQVPFFRTVKNREGGDKGRKGWVMWCSRVDTVVISE